MVACGDLGIDIWKCKRGGFDNLWDWFAQMISLELRLFADL